MKLPPFEHHRPASAEEAIALLAAIGDDAKVIAGGQSLLPLMAFRLARPSALVDLGAVDELRGVAVEDGAVRIGATTTQSAVEDHAAAAAAHPLLPEAIGWIGHRAIRNRGTIGGSLAHADPAAELPLVALVLDAEVELVSPRGPRTLPTSELAQGFLQTAVAPDELVASIHLPALAPRTGCAFEEVARRHGDFAMVSAAATVTVDDDGSVTAARLGLGAVDQRPRRIGEVELALRGCSVASGSGDDGIATALAGLPDLLDPPDDVHATADYRRVVAGTLAARALRRAARAATGHQEDHS